MMKKGVFVSTFITLVLLAFICAAEKTSDETWNWMPQWRDKTDCGPNALYVLMNLERHHVKLKQVKKLITLDPVKGCSMESLIQASEKLGFPLEARFVKPGELSKLPRPFIFHGITSHEKNLGHFVVAVDYDGKKKNYALIDPIRETFGWNPATRTVLKGPGIWLRTISENTPMSGFSDSSTDWPIASSKAR